VTDATTSQEAAFGMQNKPEMSEFRSKILDFALPGHAIHAAVADF